MTTLKEGADPAVRSDSARKVLDSALELFIERGFDGASLQDIADRVQVTKAAVYYHFHTKDEILEALVRPAFDELRALMDEIATGRPSGRREAELSAYVDYLMRNRRIAALFSRDASVLGRPVVVAATNDLRGGVEAVLIGAQADDLSRAWGAALMQALSGALLASEHAPEEWLRQELTAIGRHLIAGHRRAARLASGGRDD